MYTWDQRRGYSSEVITSAQVLSRKCWLLTSTTCFSSSRQVKSLITSAGGRHSKSGWYGSAPQEVGAFAGGVWKEMVVSAMDTCTTMRPGGGKGTSSMKLQM